jgi:hypothetical protein
MVDAGLLKGKGEESEKDRGQREINIFRHSRKDHKLYSISTHDTLYKSYNAYAQQKSERGCIHTTH